MRLRSAYCSMFTVHDYGRWRALYRCRPDGGSAQSISTTNFTNAVTNARAFSSNRPRLQESILADGVSQRGLSAVATGPGLLVRRRERRVCRRQHPLAGVGRCRHLQTRPPLMRDLPQWSSIRSLPTHRCDPHVAQRRTVLPPQRVPRTWRHRGFSIVNSFTAKHRTSLRRIPGFGRDQLDQNYPNPF
jgi:hypothetical protein